MIIRHKTHEEDIAWNMFEAYDDMENYLGEASVESTYWPLVSDVRPSVFTIRESGDPAATDMLLSAATAHVLELAREVEGRVCVRVEVQPGNEDKMAETLEMLGYSGKSAILRMRAALHTDPVTAQLPEGLTIVRDYLNDEKEREFYLDRVNTIFDSHRDAQWLQEVREKPCFTRILIIDENGAAGEMITWAEGMTGVVENIWVHPDWRGRGAGRYLLEFARMYWLNCNLESARMDVWSRLQPAVRLALSAGFKPSEAVVEYPFMDVR